MKLFVYTNMKGSIEPWPATTFLVIIIEFKYFKQLYLMNGENNLQIV